MSDLSNDSTRIKKFTVKAYNLKELAAIYNISKYLMRKRMKRFKSQIGEPDGYLYQAEQVELIFGLIRLPSNIRIIKV